MKYYNQVKPDLASPTQVRTHAHLFYAGSFVSFVGPLAPKSYIPPEGMEIVAWDHPRFFWLKYEGSFLAGPARREVLESFVYNLCTKSEKAAELAGILGKVDELPNRKRDRGD